MSAQRCAEDEFQPQSERPEMGPASVSSVRALPSTDWALNMKQLKEGRKEGRRKGVRRPEMYLTRGQVERAGLRALPGGTDGPGKSWRARVS